MTEIEEWAKKNMFISIFTVIHNNRIEWSAGVRVGMDNKTPGYHLKMKDASLVHF